MKKNEFKKWLRQWDAGEINFDPKEAAPPQKQSDLSKDWNPKDTNSRLERRQVDVFKKTYPVMVTVLAFVLISFLFMTVAELPAFGVADAPTNNEVSQRYIEEGIHETGAVNIVAGVILDYRAFDTLGESHVLYTAATAVLILLLTAGGAEPEEEQKSLKNDVILRKTASIIVPLVLLFGIYVMFNGHLGPGGGFSGGAIIGGGLILYVIAYGFERLEKLLNLKTYRIIVLVALCFYSCAKCYSFFCGANHLQSGISIGTAGRIFSAGLILPLNLAVGVVVACTMYGFYSVFKRGRI